MLKTLKAAVNGDRIQWLEASEQSFPASHPIAALITPMHEQPASLSDEQRAERRLAALKKPAAINALVSDALVADIGEWVQRGR